MQFNLWIVNEGGEVIDFRGLSFYHVSKRAELYYKSETSFSKQPRLFKIPMKPLIEIPKKVVITGAGPAGLTAAYELCKAGIESVVLEKDNIVGGLARTVNYKENLGVIA